MSGRRLPPTLLGGRIRTSTAILAALFAGFLALYVIVRPPPDTGPSSRAAQEAREREREREPEPTSTPTGTPAATETPSGTSEPTATPTPERTPTAEPTPEKEEEPSPTPTAQPDEGQPSPGAEATPTP